MNKIQLIYDFETKTFLFGTEQNGFGVFQDESDDLWYANIITPISGLMINKKNNFDEIIKEAYETYLKFQE